MSSTLSLLPNAVVIVVEKLASSFSAAANSFNVSNAAGAESTNEAVLPSIYALTDDWVAK